MRGGTTVGLNNPAVRSGEHSVSGLRHARRTPSQHATTLTRADIAVWFLAQALDARHSTAVYNILSRCPAWVWKCQMPHGPLPQQLGEWNNVRTCEPQLKYKVMLRESGSTQAVTTCVCGRAREFGQYHFRRQSTHGVGEKTTRRTIRTLYGRMDPARRLRLLAFVRFKGFTHCCTSPLAAPPADTVEGCVLWIKDRPPSASTGEYAPR
jgi:hypothetical protein